jgi:hypothetical protein
MNRNNRPMNNNLVNKFQSYMNTNTPFQKNPLLNNNPNFMSNSRDSSFFNKINLTKLEQIKRARNIEEIGMDKNQLTDIIISPITINKTNKKELDEIYNDIVPIQKKIVEEWWNTRTNQPYKNIIKKDLFHKDYKKYYRDDIFNTNIKDKKELLVHKVTTADADSLLLEAEFDLLSDIIEKHNDELKTIYSTSKKNQYKKEFEYVQNYRYRLEYNPKNSEELKDYYKKEQKKINKEKKMIDDIISTLIENDELTKDEIDKLNKEINTFDKNNKKSSKIDNLEEELRKELGDDFEDIINNITIDSDDDIIDNKNEKMKKKINVSTSKIEIKNIDNTPFSEKPKKKIKVKTIQNEQIQNEQIQNEQIQNEQNVKTEETIKTNDSFRDKYKNRK